LCGRPGGTFTPERPPLIRGLHHRGGSFPFLAHVSHSELKVCGLRASQIFDHMRGAAVRNHYRRNPVAFEGFDVTAVLSLLSGYSCP
jgi:hypothetical protein